MVRGLAALVVALLLTACGSGGMTKAPSAPVAAGGADRPARTLTPAVPQAPASDGDDARDGATGGQPSSAAPSTLAPPAASARPGPTQRLTFAPTAVRLARSGSSARVQPIAPGAGGVLLPPDDSRVVGWWSGGAQAGAAYGSVVLAGHIDSATSGIGVFAALLTAHRGDRVRVEAGAGRQEFVVREVRDVRKLDLTADADPFDQAVPLRLVLITCTGTFDRATGHYDRNRVVVAEPVGPATRG
ncbi:sortase [Flexivirga sp. ID2601S]|uniref:Sortase n=1 Tax=Flexivirga aerilata TaxID=1656889 RepID=A0A849ACZ3_9MICO|nr:class F sortase [Flexivirga aerilata]NNG38339.1 sortase [Flexivirga aerilata]